MVLDELNDCLNKEDGSCERVATSSARPLWASFPPVLIPSDGGDVPGIFESEECDEKQERKKTKQKTALERMPTRNNTRAKATPRKRQLRHF